MVFIHARGEAAASIASPGIDGDGTGTQLPACVMEDDRTPFSQNPLSFFAIGPQFLSSLTTQGKVQRTPWAF